MAPSLFDSLLTAALAGRFEVKREIGRGGMATVYLARDVRHDRPVALKVMSPELGQGVIPDRFLAEIRTAANLQHPHIVPLYDSGEAGGLLFYTMPYVEGGITLAHRLEKEGALSVVEALRVIREIGEGLAHAHKQGLVHRDVKPSNVLFSSGHAMLADFGLARAVEKDPSARGLTQTGTYVGSPEYMAPEQAGFGTGEVDGRTDLYALGCLCYEMLTGKLPYGGGNNPLSIVSAHAFHDIPSASAARPEIPESLDSAIARAMAKDPADRFATVDEFLAAIASGEVGMPPRRRRKGLGRLAPWAAGAAAVVGLAATIFAVSSLLDGEGSAAETLLAPDRVVIAPLVNGTGDPSLDQIGRMAADWITEGLHRTGIVDVVPSATALQAAAYVGARTSSTETMVDPIEMLASETGAGKVISGRYDLDGDSLVYSMQVTDALANEVLEAMPRVRGSRSSPAAAIEQLRDNVMGSVAVKYDDRLADPDLAQMKPPSYESYSAFDEGMQRYLASEWRPAAEAFRRAFALDSTFVLALNYLTFSESNLRPRGGPVMDSLTRMLDARRGELAVYHQHWLDYLIARVRGDNETARVAIKQAADLAPASKAVYNLAFTAQLTKRPREAVEALESLDPERGPMRGWFPYWTMLTDNLHRLEEHQEELEAARRGLELHPDLGFAQLQVGQALAARGDIRELRTLSAGLNSSGMKDITPGEVWVAIADELRSHEHLAEATEFYEQALAWYDRLPRAQQEERAKLESRATALASVGRFQEARAIIAQLQEANPKELVLVGWGGSLDAWLGNRAAAEQALARMEAEEERDRYARGFYALQGARIAGALGNADKATELLVRSVARGFRPLRHLDLNFDPVKDHPPLQEALRPVG